MHRVAIVMAGGSGERFWPVSRLSRPKQLLALADPEMSLLEEAIVRAEPMFGRDSVFVATGLSVLDPILASGLVDPKRILIEPAKRNTLGCLVWAATRLEVQYGQGVSMAVLTADHRIGEPDCFRACVRTALDVAENEGALVTIGIPPTRPETGFGYIEVDSGSEKAGGVFDSMGFREKPDLATAERFLAAKNYLWNSGMYFWTLEGFQREIAAAQPDAHQIGRDLFEALTRGETEAAEARYHALPNISIDFALMEKASHVKVVASTFPWDDVGSWDALERSFDPDADGNVFVGDVIGVDSEGSLVYNDSKEILTGIVGMKDVLVVVTPDAVLVCPKNDAQRVREIVAKLKELRPDRL